MLMQFARRRLNFIALLLTVPCTSFGALMLLLVSPGIVGQSVLILCQIWLLLAPVIWQLWVERQPIVIPRVNKQDWLVGGFIGGLIFIAVLAFYGLFAKHSIDGAELLNRAQQVFPINQPLFWVSGIYVSFINSLIEEYVWRYFIYRRCEELMSTRSAVLLTALFFTLHHTIGLGYFVEPHMVVLGSLGVFIAGVIWSECYRRYRSIWNSYFSHIMADLALYIITWKILFC